MFKEATSEPGLLSRIGELRAIAEFGTLLPALPALMTAPKGDGHAVLVLPGVLTGDTSTAILRAYLNELNYDTHPWKLGHNWGPNPRIHQALRHRLVELADRYQRRISLIGWSMGGVFARELARQLPMHVRQVITLGSPIAATYDGGGSIGAELASRSSITPPVPCTSIYSRSDGVVPWAACREQIGPQTENIEVPAASHIGMGVNPLVLWAVADRLAQPEGQWKPFDRSGVSSFFYAD
ncbi:MAG: alpha/beta hydrolase [Parvibaculum sp.]